MYFIIGNADRCKEGVIMALKVKSPSSVRCKVGVTMTLKVKSLIHVRDFPPTISNPARESYSVGAPGPTQYVSLGGSSFQVLDLLRPIRKLKAIDLLKDQFRATSTEIDELRGKLAITRVECGERTSHASNSTSITTSSFHKDDVSFYSVGQTRKRSESLRWRQRRRATAHYVPNQAMPAQNVGVTSLYIDTGDCKYSREHCRARFSYR
nr:putative cupredoxin [Tanacetum cinerariifolium]